MSEGDRAGDSLPGFSDAIEALRIAGHRPSRAVADAVLHYGEAAVAPLCALLRAPETWGDLLTEDMDSVLAALGPEAIPTLVPVLLDHRADPFVRNAAGRGLYLVGCANADARGAVSAALARVIREADLGHNSDLSTAELLADDALRTGDPEAVSAVREAFSRGLADSDFVDASIIDRVSSFSAWQLRPRDAPPLTHFERAESAPGRPKIPTTWTEVRPHVGAKVGRNDPCPCGSGKKFNKCCGR